MKKKSIFTALIAMMLQSGSLINAQQLNPTGICYVEVNNNNLLNAERINCRHRTATCLMW